LKSNARARDTGFELPDNNEIGAEDANAAPKSDTTELSSADRALVKRAGTMWAVLSSLWPASPALRSIELLLESSFDCFDALSRFARVSGSATRSMFYHPDRLHVLRART